MTLTCPGGIRSTVMVVSSEVASRARSEGRALGHGSQCCGTWSDSSYRIKHILRAFTFDGHPSVIDGFGALGELRSLGARSNGSPWSRWL